MSAEEPKKKLSKKARVAREFNKQFIETLSTLLTSAFGLVAAFAWNELVKSAISKYIAPGQTIKSQLLYAVFVTLLAAIIAYQFGKIVAMYKVEEDDESAKDLKK